MLVNAQRLSQSAAHSPSRVRKGEALTWCGRQLLCSSRSAFESQIPAHRANTVFAAVSGRTEWAQMSNHCSHTGVEDSATMECTRTHHHHCFVTAGAFNCTHCNSSTGSVSIEISSLKRLATEQHTDESDSLTA
eukprot:m.378271 g.378271  ORF g.378271 m.378271 type:complete len:134 (-) comp56197_c2_seq29:363-764(-)